MFKQAKSRASLAKEMFVEYLTDIPRRQDDIYWGIF
jgi:hypothetical protein